MEIAEFAKVFLVLTNKERDKLMVMLWRSWNDCTIRHSGDHGMTSEIAMAYRSVAYSEGL